MTKREKADRAKAAALRAFNRMLRAEKRLESLELAKNRAETDLRAAKILLRETKYLAEGLEDAADAEDRAAIGRPGDAAATLHDETGIDYSRCLVMCNCD